MACVFGCHANQQPAINRKMGIHDTCGVHNLHGMPAVIGTIISIIMAAKADTALYGKVATEVKLQVTTCS